MVQIYHYLYVLEMTACRSSFAVETSRIICFTKKLSKGLGKVVYEDEYALGRGDGEHQIFLMWHVSYSKYYSLISPTPQVSMFLSIIYHLLMEIRISGSKNRLNKRKALILGQPPSSGGR